MPTADLEPQRCPFEGAFAMETNVEADLSYNPSNMFICPKMSFLSAQCDSPSRIRIHSKCTPGRPVLKSEYLTCLTCSKSRQHSR